MNLLIGILLFLSGHSALVYEMAWVRALGWTFGSTATTVAAVTSAYLLGLAIGAWIFGRLGDRARDPWRLFGRLEIAVGIYGCASPWLLSWLDGLTPGPVVAVLLTAAFVLPPTIGLGASIPILASAAVRRGAGYGSITGRFYAANTLGGIAGVLLAAYYWLVEWGTFQTIILAAIGNIAVGVIALARTRADESPIAMPAAPPPNEAVRPAPFLLGIWLAGSMSLGWEVLWTRLLAQFLRNSVYSFAATLSVYLLGLTIGAALASRWSRRLSRPLTVMLPAIVSALGLGGFLAINALSEWAEFPARLVSSLVVALGLPTGRFSSVVLGELLLSSAIVLPPAILLGLLYPCLMERNWRGRERFGSFFGDVSLVHTLGAMVGALAAGFWLLPRFELIGTAWGLAGAGVLASGVFAAALWPLNRLGWSGLGFGVTSVFIISLLLPSEGIRFWRTFEGDQELVAYREDALASVAVVRGADDQLSLRLNATGILGSSGGTLIEAREGVLAAVMHEGPESGLALGVGAGNSVAAMLRAGVRHVDAVEVVPSVLELLPHFSKTNGGVGERDDVRLIPEDGRSFLARTEKRYDVILGDLFYPWLSEAGYLYTLEHFESVRSHLEDDGVFVQWIPLHQMSWSDFGCVARTFQKVFGKQFEVWFGGSDLPVPLMALIGRRERSVGALRAITSAYSDPRKAAVLRNVGWGGAGDLLALRWGGDRAVLEEFPGSDTPLNTADAPRVEYRSARRLKSDAEMARDGFIQAGSNAKSNEHEDAWLALLSPADRRRYWIRRALMRSTGRLAESNEDSAWVAAITFLRQGLEKVPDSPALQNTAIAFAWRLLDAGEAELAEDLIPKAEARRASPAIWDEIEAAVWLAQGRPEEAETLLEAYSPNGPRDAGRRFALLAVTRLLQGDEDTASTYLSQALTHPGELPLHARVAQALLQGDRERAREILGRRPDRAPWQALLGESD
ncbi:MAG: fused MFS/spermidine synthase [Planctomycetota bacterium]